MKPAPPVTRRRIRGRLARHLGEAGPEPLTPVRKPRGIAMLASGHRVRRSWDRTLDLGGRDASDPTVEARLLEDRLGEVGPRAFTVRCQMPEPFQPIVVDEGVH